MNKEKYKYKLFGRFKGRKKINDSQKNLIHKSKIQVKEIINKNNFNILDIGSGSGENAIYLSKKYPEANIIACELFEDGNINLNKQIILKNIKNIFIYQGNVLELLDAINQKFIFDEVWILFPDPWPKIRHHKRRLINKLFLEYIYHFLKNNSLLMIASDSKLYNYAIVKLIYDSQNLYYWKNQKFECWSYDLLDLPKTKYSKKALKSDRNSMFFILNKI